MSVFNATLTPALMYHYTQQGLNRVLDMSSLAIHKALYCFALFALPSFGQLSEVHQTRTPLQHQQAVLALPFESRGYTDPWHVGKNSSIHGQGDQQDEIQVLDSRAQRLIDDDSGILLLVENEEGYAFAHEAPVYFSDHDHLYFCSDAGGKEGRSNSTTNNVVFRIDVNATITKAREHRASFADDVHPVYINSDSVQMTNGGTPYQNQLLLINSGRTSDYPPSLTVIDRSHPTRVHTLLNNAAGKQFNGLNDVKVNFHTGSIYFTDASYGQSQHFRPEVDLAKATWRFDPLTARLTMLDASIITPNGLSLSRDGKKLYITETASNPGGDLAVDPSIPSVIYAFDVVYKHNTEYLQNKRLFAHVPTGIADGIEVDNAENVYSCTGDGLYVWDPNGLLLLRVFFPNGGCVSLVFAGKGRILVTAQSRLYLVQLAPIVEGPVLDAYPRADKRIALPF